MLSFHVVVRLWCVPCLEQDGGLLRAKAHGVWKLGGHRVCFKAWVRLTGLSRNFCQKLMKHISQGLGPPRDGRSLRCVRDSPAADHVRSFFIFLHQNLAEPLAETELTTEELTEEPEILLDEWHEHIEGVSYHDLDGPVAPVVQGASLEPRQAPPVHVPHSSTKLACVSAQVVGAYHAGRALRDLYADARGCSGVGVLVPKNLYDGMAADSPDSPAFSARCL